MTKNPKRSRVIHVPLTDKEWKALHDLAFISGNTKGELTAAALREHLPARVIA
jgi:hypothetical protein